MPSKDTVKLAQTLYSRCIEHELKPDRLQFTKLLYLLDYCHCTLKGEKVSDIDWIFYHYGPYAMEMPQIMDAVMNRYPYGWVDRSEEYGGRMPSIDLAEPLESKVAEQILSKLINTFRNRDTSSIVECCYHRTEPMLAAQRGDRLDFTTVRTQGFPDFFPKMQATEMPSIPARFASRRAEFKERMRSEEAKFRRWEEKLSSPAYQTAKEVMAEELGGSIPDMNNSTIEWDSDVIEELGKYDG